MSTGLSSSLQQHQHSGLVIPANSTAPTKTLKLDERRQRALSRYYLDAGLGGLGLDLSFPGDSDYDAEIMQDGINAAKIAPESGWAAISSTLY